MSAILSSQVDFSSVDQLYTYSYSIQNDTPSTIWNVDIFVGPSPQPLAIQPIPAPYTAPQGWTMYGAFSGSIAQPPYSMLGGFYEWQGGDSPIQPGDTATGFSVTTPYAPSSNSGNDFFLYGSEGIVAYGKVVVPSGADWLMAAPYDPRPFAYGAAPEPATWLLLLIGFVAVAIFYRQSPLTDSNTMLG